MQMGVQYDVAVDGKDLKAEAPETVGVYAISNTLAICVHEIDIRTAGCWHPATGTVRSGIP